MKQRALLSATASSAALLLVLGACGQDRPDHVTAGGNGATTVAPTMAKSPKKIQLGTVPASRTTSAAEASGARPVPASDQAATGGLAIRPTTFVAGPGLTDLTGSRPAWFFPTGGTVVSDAQRAALASAFGVAGTWAALPAEQGGGQQLGPNDGSAPSITIAGDALASWWFNPSMGVGTVAEPCVAVDVAGGKPADATTPPDATAPVTTCPTPTPPVNVPDAATAEAKARALVTAIGLDPSQYQFDATGDEWGAYVTVWLLLDGQRSPMAMYVGFGAEGAVSGAGGFLARPVLGDQYPLVGIAKGIERLNDPDRGWYGSGAGVAVKTASGTATASTASAPAGSSGSGSAPADTAGGAAPSPMPVAPDQTVAVEPVTVTLTGVKADLAQVWDAEGTVWLLPAYTFTDDQGGQYTVIAVDDAFVQLPQPAPVPEPAPAPSEPAPEPAPVVTAPVVTAPAETTPAVPPVTMPAIDPAAAAQLVGLTEEEATKVATANGWAVRVVSRDGVSLPVTADYSTGRVNLTVVAGTVTAVTVG